MSIFASLEEQKEDPILGLTEAFQRDSRPEKVNLGVGSYKNAEGQPQVLSSVRKAEKILLEKHLNKEYLPISGSSAFIEELLKLTFGENSSPFLQRSIAAVQTLGGTGALRVGGELLFRSRISEKIYLPDPTWPNHFTIFSSVGMKIDSYTYYDERERRLNFPAMLDAIAKAPSGSLILLQPCCHNPTGTDPVFSQWIELCQLIKRQRLIPFLDLAYQGFDKNLVEDAKVLRLFAEEGLAFFTAVSCSKNFGLYGERVGLLAIVCQSKEEAEKVSTHLKKIIRSMYSMPPLQGQRVVTEILRSEELKKEWTHELENMRGRIQEMRNALVARLAAKGASSSFEHIAKQTGMFSFSGLNKNQVFHLQKDFGIYMPYDGRINIAGLNLQNMEYVVDSVLKLLL